VTQLSNLKSWRIRTIIDNAKSDFDLFFNFVAQHYKPSEASGKSCCKTPGTKLTKSWPYPYSQGFCVAHSFMKYDAKLESGGFDMVWGGPEKSSVLVSVSTSSFYFTPEANPVILTFPAVLLRYRRPNFCQSSTRSFLEFHAQDFDHSNFDPTKMDFYKNAKDKKPDYAVSAAHDSLQKVGKVITISKFVPGKGVAAVDILVSSLDEGTAVYDRILPSLFLRPPPIVLSTLAQSSPRKSIFGLLFTTKCPISNLSILGAAGVVGDVIVTSLLPITKMGKQNVFYPLQLILNGNGQYSYLGQFYLETFPDLAEVIYKALPTICSKDAYQAQANNYTLIFQKLIEQKTPADKLLYLLAVPDGWRYLGTDWALQKHNSIENLKTTQSALDVENGKLGEVRHV
jgi:hypothetical protein